MIDGKLHFFEIQSLRTQDNFEPGDAMPHLCKTAEVMLKLIILKVQENKQTNILYFLCIHDLIDRLNQESNNTHNHNTHNHYIAYRRYYK